MEGDKEQEEEIWKMMKLRPRWFGWVKYGIDRLLQLRSERAFQWLLMPKIILLSSALDQSCLMGMPNTIEKIC